MSISTDTRPEPARLTVTVQHLDGHADILVIGELDIATAPVLDTYLDELIAGGHDDVRLNLSGLKFLDAAGVSSLVRCRARLREAGGTITLNFVNGLPLRVLAICKLLDGFIAARPSDSVAGTVHD